MSVVRDVEAAVRASVYYSHPLAAVCLPSQRILAAQFDSVRGGMEEERRRRKAKKKQLVELSFQIQLKKNHKKESNSSWSWCQN